MKIKIEGYQISWFNLALIILGGFALLFIIGPVIGMFLHSTPVKVLETVQDKEVQASIFRTLAIAFTGTLFFAIFAVPFAYILARKEFSGKRLITGIIDLPVIIPHTAAGIAILGVISRDSLIGKGAGLLGFQLVGHPAGIALTMGFVSIPFLINAARDGFLNVPVRYEKAALNLGASPIQVFFTISLPIAWKNVVSGFVMMFGRGMSEFGAVVIVAYHPLTTPVLIFERFTEFGLSYAQPVAVIFILICLLVFILLRLLSVKKVER